MPSNTLKEHMIEKFNLTEYRVLARKYRPQKFVDLIGQEIIVQMLEMIKNTLSQFIIIVYF